MTEWIGVDFDGTLAEHHSGDGLKLGKPIPAMVDRVKLWLSQGKEVRIVTARAHKDYGQSWENHDQMVYEVNGWCRAHIGVVLPVVCWKDQHMIELWDDRAVQVIKNTGMTVAEACGLDERANDLTA